MQITSDKPLALFIGRKKQIIKQPWRLEMSREVEQFEDAQSPCVSVVTSETLRLFIGNKLFSTSRVPQHRRYGRRSLKITKPKRGYMQIHLTKKLTDFAS